MAASGLAPPLTIDLARDRIREQCFRPGDGGLIGLECEWHVYDRVDPRRIVPLDELVTMTDGIGPLPGGSLITFEPGGQLELSSPPAVGADAACAALATDHDAVAAVLAPEGLVLVATGVDPVRPPYRQLHQARYDAMEAFFDQDGPAGRRMMCRTAALQINVDSGDDAEGERRWRLAHQVGPALSAAFATSPVAEGEPTGWADTRLATWLDIDPSRTSAAPGGREEWITYALDANVMLIRRYDAMVPLRRRLPFADWIRDGSPYGAPTVDDLDYHLTTLFPPVRPRGFLEIRYLDALPDPWWRVAAGVVTAVLCDADAGERAAEACEPVADRWCDAARTGLDDPALRHAAMATVTAARDAFDRLDMGPTTSQACDQYVERYLDQGRTPGDDVLDAWRHGRPLVDLDTQEQPWT